MLSVIYLNRLNVIVVMLPAQKSKHDDGIPRSTQHGVWSILLAKHENVMFAHGAHTIKSGISVKSAFFGSHILRVKEVELKNFVSVVFPFFTINFSTT